MAVLCAAGLSGTVQLLKRTVPPPGSLGAKLAWLEAHRDEFDVLFVGSSNVMCGIIPERFDAALRALGHEARSFNLGVPGMVSFQVDHALDVVRRGASSRLKWILCELGQWPTGPAIVENDDRTVFWHTPRHTLAAIELEWAAAAPWPQRLTRVRDHCRLGLSNLFGVGGVQRHAAARLGLLSSGNEEMTPGMVGAEAGYIDLEAQPIGRSAQMRAVFLRNRDAYVRKVQEMSASAAAESAPTPGNERMFLRRVQSFADSGIQLIHIIAPMDTATPDLEALGRKHGAPVLAFNKPELYPELYVPACRYDERHLARTGAETLSVLLAREVAARLGATMK